MKKQTVINKQVESMFQYIDYLKAKKTPQKTIFEVVEILNKRIKLIDERFKND